MTARRLSLRDSGIEATALPEPLRRISAAGLAILTGILLALSFPPYGFWPFAWFSFVPFLAAIRGRGLFGGLWLGWIAGAIATFIGFSWIGDLFTEHAHLPWPIAVLGLVLSSVAHGAPMAVTGLLTCWLWRRRIRPIVAVPLSLTAAELLVPVVFPWLLAVSQRDLLLLVQIGDIIGARGISALIALGGAAIYEIGSRPSDRGTRRAFSAVALLIVTVVAYGAVRLPQIQDRRRHATSLQVGLVQPHLTIAEKHDPSRREINLSLHQDMSRELQERGAEIVIWPESAYPYYIPRSATRDHDGSRAVRRGFQLPVVFGALSIDGNRNRYNSAFLITDEGRLAGPADKMELLIFGEYIPFYDDIPLLQRWFPNAWNFMPGENPGVLVDEPLRIGILNCYEDILPEYVHRSAAQSPNLLVNITNDTWFGDTNEPYQHAASARFRAIEHRVDLIRAVNSGVSTLVASTGEVLESTPVFVRTTTIVEARLTEAGTIYTAVGDSFAWLLTLSIPVLLIWSWRRGVSTS